MHLFGNLNIAEDDMPSVQKSDNLQNLLRQYFVESKPILSKHFRLRWNQRAREKTPEELFKVFTRSEVWMCEDKFELYDPHTNIRMSYEYKDDGRVVFCSIFMLDEKFKDNWIIQFNW
jgi:hypothetical protein